MDASYVYLMALVQLQSWRLHPGNRDKVKFSEVVELALECEEAYRRRYSSESPVD